MRFLFYTHSLVSDWNHGNAHFLRGVMRVLMERGHQVRALEPADSWSRHNLLAEQGVGAVARFAADFPRLVSTQYGADFDHEAALAEADVAIVHEWTEPALVARIGRARRQLRFTALFHDTHHRVVSAESEIGQLALEPYDAVLAFGETLRRRYEQAGWGARVFTWHEAADTDLFRPLPVVPRETSLIWVGNWGDEERSAEIRQFLIEPAQRLGLHGSVHGVRYPADARRVDRGGRPRLSRLDRQCRRSARIRRPPRHDAHPAPAICRRCCPAFRRSACSRRWPAAFRCCRHPGRMRKGCSGPASIIFR